MTVNFAVLGAGNGGQSMAAYLSLKGGCVNLFNRSQDRIKFIQEQGSIELSGVYEGVAGLNRVTTGIEQAVKGVDVIMVVTPAVAHRDLARLTAPFLEDDQIVILNPGRTGGALEFHNCLRSNGCQADVVIAEAQTFVFASRVVGPARARIFGEKKKVAVAAFPSTKTRRVINRVISFLPQFSPVENILKTSLENIGAVFHPAPTILNMARIEAGSHFNYYQEGISPSVCRVLEQIDRERRQVIRKLGMEPTGAEDWLRISYRTRGNNLYELLQNNEQYRGIKAPQTLNTRYIFEDVPMSLVPVASIGEMYGLETPVINMIIDLANIVHDTDYREIGRTVDSLGIAGLTVRELKNLVNWGTIRVERTLPGLRQTISRKIDRVVFNELSKEYQQEGGIEG
ncbi:MAG: NAD/NADP octopine/nopaline dehydrogenase family protein [Bacillota bacterium]